MDSVSEVVDISSDSRIEPPEAINKELEGLVRDVADISGRLVVLLELERILNSRDKES